MKKLIVSLALVFLGAQVYAQNVANAVKVLEKAQAESVNPKKVANPVTWVKLGTAYSDCFDAQASGVWGGMTQMEAKMLLKDQQVLSSAQEELSGALYTVDTYEDKVLYYDETGKLAAWIITKPAVADVDLLLESFNAFSKANELDAKGSQKKVLVESLKGLQSRYMGDGMSYYTIGNTAEASKKFEMAAQVAAHPLLGLVDSTMIYYAAVTATMAGDLARAAKFFEECIKIDYVQDGDVFASLADCYKKGGDTAKAMETLNSGFLKYPLSQSILVGLINIYMEADEEPAKLVELLKTAQANEPNNPSLYYAEGNVYAKLQDYTKAIEAYKKSAEIDPAYFWAPFSEGKTYYDWAVDIQNQANLESDDNKYMELVKQFDECLKNSIVPLEKAFNLTGGDVELQAYVAELLKNVYFRYREESPENQANYEKYNTFLQENGK
ncbi:MAG: tetratricopeptide repeat protein [Bacteroidales bacterium]|nr:tetratricopeptide repeat protein [Bacteroidales bacterium]